MPRTGAYPARGGLLAAPRFFVSGRAGTAVLAAALAVLAFAGSGSSAGAETATIAVQATVLSKSQCKFDTKASILAFGSLDPANPLDVTATASIPFVCRGSAPVAVFAFSDDGGLYPSGPGRPRMRHATDTSEFLRYSIAFSPAFGTAPKNAPQTLIVTGTVLGVDYPGARAGNYFDTLVVSILP